MLDRAAAARSTRSALAAIVDPRVAARRTSCDPSFQLLVRRARARAAAGRRRSRGASRALARAKASRRRRGSRSTPRRSPPTTFTRSPPAASSATCVLTPLARAGRAAARARRARARHRLGGALAIRSRRGSSASSTTLAGRARARRRRSARSRSRAPIIAARARRARAVARDPRRAARALDALAWLALCVGWALARTPPPPGALRVTFLDVGQGDAAIVELPDGAVWLVDAGGIASRARPRGREPHPAARSRARSRRTATIAIDLAIISHPHPDHYLGLAALGVPIASCGPPPSDSRPSRGDSRDRAAELRRRSRARHRSHHPPLGLARREAGVELVGVGPRYASATASPSARRRSGAHGQRQLARRRARATPAARSLFAGDVEAEGEDALVAAGLGARRCRQGRRTTAARPRRPPAFVAATHPALAVISCGVANAFGFPSPEVVERWRAAGAEVARTDTTARSR